MSWTAPNTFTAGNIIVAEDVNENFTSLSDKFNAGITNADVAASASIALSKLQTIYQDVVVQASIQGAWSAAGTGLNETLTELGFLPSDTNGDWTAYEIQWACTDCGTANDAQVRIEIGNFDATGVWAAAHSFPSVSTNYTLARVGATSNVGNQAIAASGLTTAITTADPLMLRVRVLAAGTGWMTAATDRFTVSLHLRRAVHV